jgi:hypothetical protein
LATAIAGAAGGNVTGTVDSLIQNTAIYALQSLAVTQVKRIADGFGSKDDAGNFVPTGQSEVVRGLLQGFVGCAGAAAASGSCSSGAAGAAGSVALNNLITLLLEPETKDPTTGRILPRSLDEQQARAQLIATLTGALVGALGGNANDASVAGQVETENNDQVETAAGPICVSGQVKCNGTPIDIKDIHTLSKNNNLRKLYDLVLKTYGISDKSRAQMTEAEQALVDNTILSHISYGIDLYYFENQERRDAIFAAQTSFFYTLDEAARTEAIARYGSAGAAILHHSLTTSDDWQPNLLESLLDPVDISKSLFENVGTTLGTAKLGLDTLKLAGGVVLSPSETYGRAAEILKYIRENPEKFIGILSQSAIDSQNELKSNLAKLEYAKKIGDRTQIYNASYAVSKSVGPFLNSFSKNTFVATNTLRNTINAILYTGRAPDTSPSVNVPVPAGSLPQIRVNQIAGSQFERQVLDALYHVGASKNTSLTGVKVNADGSIGGTIIDAQGRNIGGYLEIKNVLDLSLSKQLESFVAVARATGAPLNIIVSPRTRYISGPIRDAVTRTGGGIFVFDPATGSVVEWK